MPTTTTPQAKRPTTNQVLLKLIKQEKKNTEAIGNVIDDLSDNTDYMQKLLEALNKLSSRLDALTASITVPMDVDGALRANEYNVYNFDQVAQEIVKIRKMMMKDVVVNFNEDDTTHFMRMLERDLHQSVGQALTNMTAGEIKQTLKRFNDNSEALLNAHAEVLKPQPTDRQKFPEWLPYLLVINTISAVGILMASLAVLGVNKWICLVIGMLILVGAGGWSWFKFVYKTGDDE